MNEALLERARFNMLQQQIRPWHPVSDRVLETMRSIPRELFVPMGYRNIAFADVDLPLGANTRMPSPKIEARMLHALAIQPTDNILEIGTGSGYMTACLARLGGYVTSIDQTGSLTQAAEQKLGALGINNVSLTQASLDGALPGGSFDVILVNGVSLPQRDPHLEQILTLNGRLFAVIGSGYPMEACLITRPEQDRWQMESLFETEMPSLTPMEKRAGFQF